MAFEDKAGASPKPHYLGHRKRLKERFSSRGAEALQDYELLELLLFRIFPRRDTKPLAKALIDKFGSFPAVFHAPPEQLMEVEGIGQAAVLELKILRAAALRLLQKDILDKPVINTWEKLIDYCYAVMAHETREQFRILYLDKKNRLIADEIQQQGTVDHTPVYIREIVKRTLELSATAIILVHNHPSGDPSPSAADIEMTNAIISTAQGMNITIHDHIIVGREGHCSFRGEGLI